MRAACAGAALGGAVWLALGLVGCQSSSDTPVSFVAGLRVLGIKAEPPQAAPGASATVTALAIDTAGGAPAISWSACLRPPQIGESVNEDCVDAPDAAYIDPIGDGPTITAVMPQVTADALGAIDATGGVYLPLVASVTEARSAITAVYRWRFSDGTTPDNVNPAIASVYALDAGGAMTPLDPATPTPVATGSAVSLGVTFTPDSVESYTAANGASVTEVLTTSWFCTAGDLSVEKTSATQPETVLHLDQRLPPAGTLIELYAVARDGRGGSDFAHRTLLLR